MKKGKKIGLGIVIGIVVIIAILAVWQWDNIKAIYMGITYSDQKIETKITESKEKLADKLEKEGIVNEKIIAGFSKEDEEKLAKGEITVEEAVEKLFEPEEPVNNEAENSASSETNDKPEDSANKSDSDKKEDKVVNEQKPKQENKPEEPKADTSKKNDEKNNDTVEQKQPENNNQTGQSDNSSKSKAMIEAAVKEMYALKASYVQQLAAIERSAKALYVQGEMTQERKLEIADSLMPQLVDSERACDAQVEAILGDLKNNLSAIGADTSVVQDIRVQYQNEKQLQKSKYISKYM